MHALYCPSELVLNCLHWTRSICKVYVKCRLWNIVKLSNFVERFFFIIFHVCTYAGMYTSASGWSAEGSLSCFTVLFSLSSLGMIPSLNSCRQYWLCSQFTSPSKLQPRSLLWHFHVICHLIWKKLNPEERYFISPLHTAQTLWHYTTPISLCRSTLAMSVVSVNIFSTALPPFCCLEDQQAHCLWRRMITLRSHLSTRNCTIPTLALSTPLHQTTPPLRTRQNKWSNV